MERLQIDCTDRSPLVFDGELLAKFTSPQHETEDGQRGYELALYTHADGGFVVSIKYLTTCPHEQSVVQAEIVDEPQDVENVLLVFEPCQPVDQKSMRVLSNQQRQQLRKALYRSYDDQAARILNTLAEYYGDWPDEPTTGENASEPAPRRGLLDFFRLK